MMKKLVIALAACVMAGAVSAQVTSQVVGYQTVPLTQNGYTFTCATLAPIGMTGGNMTLGDIAANENFAPFEDSVQIFDASGSVILTVTYVSPAAVEGTEFEPGWYDYADIEMTGGTLDSTPIVAGQGITVFTGYAGAAIIIPNPLP